MAACAWRTARADWLFLPVVGLDVFRAFGGSPDIYAGPIFVYENFAQAASGAPSAFTTSSLALGVTLLTIVPVLELVVTLTGLGLLRRGWGPRMLGALAFGTVLAGTGAVLGVVFFVASLLLLPDFALSYPYTVPRPFVGSYLTLAGCVFVLVGLLAVRRTRA